MIKLYDISRRFPGRTSVEIRLWTCWAVSLASRADFDSEVASCAAEAVLGAAEGLRGVSHLYGSEAEDKREETEGQVARNCHRVLERGRT